MNGTTVSHYQIEEKIGGGGMGDVYRARDTRLDRTVALKFLVTDYTSDPAAKQRFMHEARSASALQHHNICTIHDIDETPSGDLFICMDCYDGENLTSRIARGPLPVADAIDIATQIAEGLAAAHGAGVVHRDVKPANVIMTRGGVAKIVDFGLAKLAGQTRVTRTGVAVGTISYMSPEQGRGEEVDQRSDIWALGVVLYEMLTGVVPFAADHTAAVMYLIASRDPKPLSYHRKDLPGDLQRVVDKALQKDPDKRYTSAIEFRDDLRRITEGLRPRAFRHRTAARVAVTALLVAGAVATWPALSGWLHDGTAQPHVAVLPFENVGGDPSNQAFCDGLMETLTSQLTQLEHLHGSLWVVPAAEVRTSRVVSPREARSAFGANLVLSGSVQRLSGVYRVNLNLIAVDGSGASRQVHANTFDENVLTIAALQDEAAKRVMEMLDIELVPDAQARLRSGGTQESSAYRLYVQGRGYLTRYESEDNLAHAIESFEAAIRHDSLYALAHTGLGEAYWRRYGNTQDPRWIEPAVDQCMRALKIDDNLAVAYVALGMIHAGTGDPQQAVREFDHAIEIEPTNADAYRGLATAYTRMDQSERAESTYLRAIRMKPTYWGGYNELGWFYYREARYADAIEQFDRVVELTPDNILGYNNLGASYWMSGDLPRARENFERSIAVEKNYRAYSNLSAIHYIEGRYAEAAAMCEAALALNDAGYQTWANLGNALHWIDGRQDDSRQAFREAVTRAEDQLTRTPNDPHLLCSIAGYCAVLGEKDRAVDLAMRAIALAPDNARVCYYAGHTFEQVGARERALDCIKKALDKGYTVLEMEQDPWLRGLVADERFQQIAQEYHKRGG